MHFSYIFYRFIYKPLLKIYLKFDSNITFDDFRLKVLKGVFHPKLFFSTKYLYSFLKNQSLDKSNFLEIGCGSGILSILAYKKGAKVTAVDIDAKAVKNTRLNFLMNFTDLSNIKILESDLFSNLPEQKFDVIVINPPYYFKKVEAETQHAWYCGENGEYFESLFLKVADYMNINAKVYMVLEENCEIERIKSVAKRNGIDMELVNEKQIKWEKNYIFKLNPILIRSVVF
jgi:release factor glutamine methyltransferase